MMDPERDHSDKVVGEKKRYARDELFKLGQSIQVDNRQLIEDLNRFKEFDWSKYNLDLIEKQKDDDEANPTNFMSNFGRQKSELGHEYSSLIDSRSYVGDARGNSINYKHNRISRMISSPTIKYNNKNRFNDTPYESISSQVKEKYVKLIETLSGPSQNRSSEPIQRQPLSRTVSMSNERSVERPTQLFGSLRKEIPRQSRNYFDGPTSLPYITTNEHEQKKSALGTRVLRDDSSSLMQQRIKSPDNRETERKTEAEDDDFDITSLLSITVLSDIKTIRQDSQGYTRTGFPSGYVKTNPRVRNQETLIRPLVRARTATEFTYSSRHNLQERQQNYFGSSTTSNLSQTNGSYSWYAQQDLTARRERSLEAQLANEVKSAKPVDESAARIIETFKTQVKARATAVGLDASISSEKADGKVPRESAAKRERLSTEIKTNASTPEVHKTESSNKDSTRSTPIAARIGSESEEPDEPPATKKNPSTRTLSNIPRLISLHKNERLSSKVSLDESNRGNLSSNDSKFPVSTRSNQNIATSAKSTKIVSQYKLLRGKSLADELDDSTK